jgi:DNA-binding LacI/PurR family transcriptional regulator
MAPPKKKRRRTSDRVTLDDISRYCNVSKATVSRVLNDKLKEFPVSEEMILKVKNAAQQLGFRPNRLARAVRSQRTNLIGLSIFHIDYASFMPDFLDYESQAMGKFINAILSHPGFEQYDLVIHDRRENPVKPLMTGDFKTDLLDGMIYLTPSESHTEFFQVASQDFPVVLLGRTSSSELKVPCVDIDNRKMGKKAVEHLIDTGRRRILMLIPEKIQHICCVQDRLQGYKDALAEHQLEILPELVRTVQSLPETVLGFLQGLRGLDEIDAIFCPYDELAELCIRSLKTMGKRIPEDIAVMGFDDTAIAQHTVPSLSSVRRPVEKQAHEAVDLLLKILKKEIPYEPGFHEIETTLVIRESTVKQQA